MTTTEQALERIPNYLLCGHINLHRSGTCAAQLVTYINHALSNFRMDGEGVVHSQFIPSQRNPRTVTEWREQRRDHVIDMNDNDSDNDENDSQSDEDSVTSDSDPEEASVQSQVAASQRFQRQLNQFLAQIRRETPQGQQQEELVGKKPYSFLFAVQEPNHYQEKLTAIKGGINIFDTKAKVIRAALVMSACLNAWPVQDLMTGDLAVAQMNLSSGVTLYVASVYADGKQAAISRKLKELVNRAKREKAEVLIMGDLNSHSEELWNDKTTDDRGREWEDFVLNKDLKVHNVGDTFTFNTKKGQSIIDVTISSAGLKNMIKNWRVADGVPASDHVSCEFILQVECGTEVEVWKFKRSDWVLFEQTLAAKKSRNQGCKNWNPNMMENEAEGIVEDVLDSLTEACPKVIKKVGLNPIDWWDPECKRLHKRLHDIRSYRRKHEKFNKNRRAKYTEADEIQCQKGLNAACRRAKRRGFQEFVGELKTNNQAAKLSKAVNRATGKEMSLMKHPDGNLTTPRGTIGILAGTHFPGSRTTPNPRPRRKMCEECDIDDEKVEWLNMKRLKSVIKSFGPMKGPGPDTFPPIVWQHVGEEMLIRLLNVYKASTLLGIMPEKWREIRVIFLAKADKPSYDVPKAFRPISLMNFIMKIQEKIIIWYIMDTVMIDRPLQDEQFGFRTMRSCEACLTMIYQNVDKGLLKRLYTIMALLDIEGCYDNLQNRMMIQALRNRGVMEEIVCWYEDFFYHRNIIINHRGVSLKIYPTQGAPQGGVGSPLIFNLMADELIKMIKSVPEVKIGMYADDACIFSTSSDPNVAVNRVQRALNKAMEWGEENKLRFSPTKSMALCFTRRHKPKKPRNLKVHGQNIDYVKEARHLGVIVDPKLSWNRHINEKCKATRKIIFKNVGMTGRNWGYNPLIASYIWKGIGRPKLTYGNLLWYPALRHKTKVDQLRRVQSLSFRLIASYRKRSPIAGLEMIFNTMPIEIYCLKLALKTYIRTMQFAKIPESDLWTASDSLKSHRQWMSEKLEETGKSWLKNPNDLIPIQRKWERAFKVNLESANVKNKDRGKPNSLHKWQLYTDGSKMEDISGAGMAVFNGGQPWEQGQHHNAWHLGTHPDIFQCEVFGLKQAVQWIIDNREDIGSDSVAIFTDNISVLYALNSIYIKKELVLETFQLLQEAILEHGISMIEIFWIKGHAKHIGNEKADELAKMGAQHVQLRANNPPKMPWSLVCSEVDKIGYKDWAKKWKESGDNVYRQTKHWFPAGPVPKLSYAILRMPKVMCGQMVGFITGHNFLSRHSALVRNSQIRLAKKKLMRMEILGLDPSEELLELANSEAAKAECGFCGEGEQTTMHIMSECDKFAALRLAVFGVAEPKPPYTMPVGKVVDFLKQAKIETLEMFDTYKEYLKHCITGPSSSDEEE